MSSMKRGTIGSDLRLTLLLTALIFGATFVTSTASDAQKKPDARTAQFLRFVPVELAKAERPLSDELLAYIDWRGGETVSFWVFFTDKGTQAAAQLRGPSTSLLSERALTRRAKVNRRELVFADLPVSDVYLDAVRAAGAQFEARSRWLNAGAFTLPSTDASQLRETLEQIAALPFVVELRPAVTYTRHEEDLQVEESLQRSPSAVADLLNYGSSAAQLLQINAQVGHEQGYNGSGVTIAMFDTGYRTSHQAFTALINAGRLLGQWDFINNDGVTDNELGDPSNSWSHGTLTWSTAGGQVDGTLYGPAYGANFLLAKTENVSSETIQEEYDWVAALEWADSLGADVVSSSLAYADWYTQSDFDGATAVTTLAANMAASLGIVVCNAAANAGPSPSTLNAPADAYDILTCGAVDANGVIASFSSRGPTADGRIKPDVCARGVGTLCGGANGDTYYTTASGTSLSTPLVAGVTAQLIQARPTFPPTLIMRALRETASQSIAPNNDYGWGVINLAAALDWGVRFEAMSSSADLIVVDHPATVNFTDVSDLTGSAWNWNFGDGGSSTAQNPSHQYAAPGTYSVDLTLETVYGSFERVKSNLIVVRADTISVVSDSAYAGQTLAVRVELTNAQPTRVIQVPLSYNIDPSLSYDSVTAGSRTAGYTVTLNAHDSFNKRVTASAISAGADLAPGSGEVLIFYFTIDNAAPGGASGAITSPGGNDLYIATDAVAFPPVFVSGTASSRYVLRGDSDGDGKINIRDVIFVLNGIFLSGPQPVATQAADADADGSLTIADATYLISYIFAGGPPPPTP